METSDRNTQQIFMASFVLAVAVMVAWLSYPREPAEAFLFPRLISVVFLVLSVWNFIRAITGIARIGEGVTMSAAIHILPGLVVMAVYAFWMAKFLGFYVASTITFLALLSLYDPALSHRHVSTWLRRSAITGLFIFVLYALFALLLKVQLPRGLFI